MIDLDQHTDVLSDPTAAEEGRLNELHDTLTARVDELRPKIADRSLSDDELSELGRITPALRDVTGERANRHAAREQQYGDAEAFLSEFDASQSAPEEAETGESGDAEGTDEQADEGGEEQGSETPEQVAVAASGGKRKATTGKPRVPAIGTTGAHADNGKPKTPGHQAQIAITAAADVSGYTAGQTMPFERIGEAISERLGAMRTVGGGNGEQVRVATLRASGVPEHRQLKRGSVGLNTNRLDAVTNPAALTAAGGLCAPLAIDYTYQAIGSQGRPVRDSMLMFQAERGGIQFRPDISPVTDTSSPSPFDATGHWTMDDDGNVVGGLSDPQDEPKRKAVWIVDCPATQTAEVEAITLQTEWSNVTSRFDPETVQANQVAALVAHDRHCENWLMQTLQAKSKIVKTTQILGGTRDLLVCLDRISAYYRSRHRLTDSVKLRAIMPFWAKFMIRSDMARTMALNPTETLALTDAQIEGFLNTRGVSPVWHIDGKDGNTAAVTGPPAIPAIEAQQYVALSQGAAVPDYPATVDFLLHHEGCFTYLDGGTLDLGIVRDADLISINRYRQFSEEFAGVAQRGVEPLRVLAKCSPTGETAGAINVDAGQ